MKRLLFGSWMVALLLILACADRKVVIEPPREFNQAISDGALQFRLGLFQALNTDAGAGNVFCSPSSVAAVLHMAMLGAAGQTRQEMADVLGETHVRQCIRGGENFGLNVTLEVANSLWINDRYKLKREYVAQVQSRFDAQAARLEFSSPRSLDTINTWVDERTHHKISRALGELNPEDILVLINATYFKGRWENEFDPGVTKDAAFHLAAGGQVDIPMMAMNRDDFLYYHGDGFQAIRLPYGGERIEMIVMLPDAEQGLDELIRSLSVMRLKRLMTEFREREGLLQLPRFKVKCDFRLNDALRKMGMVTPFSEQGADFSGITTKEKAHISRIIQKAMLEVNEQGAEAVAVTAMTLEPESANIRIEEPFIMNVDHPFLCMIRDSYSRELLFIGAIRSPK